MPEQLEGEVAVRRYLTYLSDPDSLRDEAAIARLEQQVADTTDPIDKLRLLADLERLRSVDEVTFREAFVREAKAWADDEGIPAAAFRELGVPPDVLAEAGFERSRRGRPPGRSASGARGRRRSSGVGPRVSGEHVRSVALSQKGRFTATELTERSGGSPATVRNVLKALVDEGAVRDLGSDPGHSGRGRAPHLFEGT